ncbi:polysaccharide biosynthesis tyrosine autokinase [Luteimonas sp. FCS-9]|uniref:GumC family protein n=1 Tax=Luteimonas sp. FCS-9 TaxID=1547516 RepID=UPI00063EB357|nr:polysaccharide biosynthesis tyrosine autokinase [Luteimonas sp. FCS-9]KLJ00724.1 hypothetical protein WQ56_07970 [Luteimonas sp. FCS-9]
MQDDHLPAVTGDDGHGERRLPAHGSGQLTPAGARGLSVELLEGKRGTGNEIDLLTYWRILVKRRWLVLGVLGAVVAVTLLATLLMPPVYRATATLQIDRETVQIMQVEGMTNAEGTSTPDFLTTQYELLRSRALAERVADELRIDRATVERLRATSWWQRASAALRPSAGNDATDTADENVADAVDEAAQDDGRADLAQGTALVRDGPTIEPVRNSRLVRVHFDSTLPGFSARVANAIADGFIESGVERRFGASSHASRYLEAQLALAKGRLEESERALVAFATRENIVGSGEGGLSLEGQNLSTLNTALAAAQDQRIQAQALWQQVGGGGSLPAAAVGASIINTLQQQRAQLNAQYQQQLQTFKSDYPAMRALKEQIDEVGRQLQEERASVRASIKAEYDAARARENMLLSQLAQLRTQALDVDNRSIDYNILRREVDTNRQLYDGLLQRYKQIGVAGGGGANNISIVDRAIVPASRFKPSLPRNLALGLAIGLVLGALLAFLLEFLDDTLKSPDDVEQDLRLAVLGVIPRLKKQTVANAQADPRSAFSEAYRSVRTALQFSTDRGVPRTLLITSASAAEGKSTTALTLARNFAQLGKRVLLIDADLRNPSLHKTLEVRSETGLSSLLAGAAAMGKAVVDTDDERLKVILAGPLPPNPAELLSGNRLLSLLTVAAEHYDQVIIDGPPVLGIADAPLLSNVVGGTLLVVQAGSTRRKTAQTALKRLLVARARVIGALLTHYDAKVAGQDDDYASYYAYGTSPRLTGNP